MENDLESLGDAFWKFVDQKIGEGYSPMAVAGVMASQSMMIYKSAMSDEEYERITDFIYTSRDKVQKITSRTGLH